MIQVWGTSHELIPVSLCVPAGLCLGYFRLVNFWALSQRWLPLCRLSDRAPEDGGDKGEEFWWDHLLLRQFISTLYPSASDSLDTHAHVQRHKQMDKHIWCWLSWALESLENHFYQLLLADVHPHKSLYLFKADLNVKMFFRIMWPLS